MRAFIDCSLQLRFHQKYLSLHLFANFSPIPLSGRRLTPQGTRDLDRIAGQVRLSPNGIVDASV